MKKLRSKEKASASDRAVMPKAETRQANTRDFVSPEFNAMMTQALTTERVISDGIDLHALRAEIQRACDEVNAGDMHLPERMALAQAHTLNHLFNRLTRGAFANFGGPWFEPFMRLALRAQAQSTRTLETLASLKHPPFFARQMNIANQQLVTNGTAPLEATPALPASPPAKNPIVRLAKSEFPARAHEWVEQ